MTKRQVFIIELETPPGGFIYQSDVTNALACKGLDVVSIAQVPGISAAEVERLARNAEGTGWVSSAQRFSAS